jgi:hypothetical protein
VILVCMILKTESAVTETLSGGFDQGRVVCHVAVCRVEQGQGKET